jgi:hypothetical protein
MMAATGRGVRRRRHDKSQYGHSRDPYLSLGLPMSGRNSGCLPFLVSGRALAPNDWE